MREIYSRTASFLTFCRADITLFVNTLSIEMIPMFYYIRNATTNIAIISLMGILTCLAVPATSQDSAGSGSKSAPLKAVQQEINVSLDYVKQYGNIASPDANERLYEPRDVARDRDRNVYILDTGNFRIQKFDSDGAFVQSIGTKGTDAGQMLFPSSIDVDTRGNIFVTDPGNAAIISFNPDGTHRLTIPLSRRVHTIRLLHKNNILENLYSGSIRYTAQSGREGGSVVPLMRIRDNNGDELRTFGIPEDFEEARTNFEANRFHMAIDDSDNVYIAYLHLNRIEKYTLRGEPLLQIQRPLDYDHSITKSIYEKSGDREYVTRPVMPDIAEGIAVDGRQRIWVLTYRKQPEGVEKSDLLMFEIFTPDGVLRRRLHFKEFFRTPGNTIRTYGDRLFIIETYGGMCVHEYRIREKN